MSIELSFHGWLCVTLLAALTFAARAAPGDSCPAAAAYQWKSTAWGIRCSPAVEDRVDSNAMLIENDISSETLCSNNFEDSLVGEMEAVLEDASRWLQSLCFRAPVVRELRNAATERYRADLMLGDALDGNFGEYWEGRFLVNYEQLSTLLVDGKEVPRESAATGSAAGSGDTRDASESPQRGSGPLELKASSKGKMTLVHELFHAIQANYPVFKHDDWDAWVVEGTAQAVEHSWARRRGWHLRGEPRFFDDPLDRPRSSDHAYMTSIFWLWLGDHLQSTDGIAYLEPMFALGEFREGEGVSDLESYLIGEETRLFDVFPAFIAERADLKAMYAGGDREISIRYREPEAEEAYESQVKLLAADPVTVKADVPGNKSAELEIKVRGLEPELHLVVGNEVFSQVSPLSAMPESQRITRPEFREPRWQAEHNRFVAPVRGGEDNEFFVRVAYARRSHSESAAPGPSSKAYTLDIKLRPLGTCEFSASLQGDATPTSARGSVAHFSATGGSTATGLMTNESRLDDMARFLEMMSGGRMSDEERAELEASKRAWKEEMATMPVETLGITLMEMEVDGDASSQLASALGGFRLQLSVFDQPIEPGFTGALEPGLVTVMTGDWTEDFSRQVQYAWATGEEGDASLTINSYSDRVLDGNLSATLIGQGVYKTGSGERPRLTVSAGFRARLHEPLRGELGCIGLED